MVNLVDHCFKNILGIFRPNGLAEMTIRLMTVCSGRRSETVLLVSTILWSIGRVKVTFRPPLALTPDELSPVVSMIR
jgi:hypothetical protein